MTHYEDAINAVNALNNDLIDTEQALAVSKTLSDELRLVVEDQKSTIVQLRKDLADCKASHRPPVLFGANVGGYAATMGEPGQAAFARILEGFGAINLVRWWANNYFQWSAVPAFYGDRPIAANLGSDIIGLNAGRYDADLRRICTEATRRTLLTVGHEPEDDVFEKRAFTVPQWQVGQARAARIVKEVGNELVSFGPLLMGTSFHPTRYASAAPGNVRAAEWFNFNLIDIDFIGADLYQWGKDDQTADAADVQFNPYLALCIEKGKAAFVGELGTRRPNPPHSPGISPAKRAQYLEQAITIIDTTTVPVLGACYYETDRGAADKVPWNLLAPAGKPQHSPEAIDVWKAVSTR